MKAKGIKSFSCRVLHEKEKRNLAMLELIRKKGAISRTDISKATGVNVVSVSNYISGFIEKNLVLEKGLAASSGGRKPELVELNTKENHCIGVDICAEEISTVLVDIGMNILSKNRSPRPANKRDVTATAKTLIEDVIKVSAVSKDSVMTIGMSVCSEKLSGVRDDIEKHFGIDTIAGSSALCGAYAEKNFNTNADSKTLLYMHSDLGRGVIIDGDVFIGSAEDSVREDEKESAVNAGESADAYCAEKTRYLDPWSSYLGIVETAKREVARGVGTSIVSLSGGSVDNITESIVLAAARQNDETALNIVQSVAINLGLRIAYLINLFAPEVVVVGGGLEQARDITFPLIGKMASKLSVKKYNGTVKIIPSGLGKDGLCLGASALAVREGFIKA